MAAVFDGKTKIGRAVADPNTDHMLPNPHSLALGAINTPVALSGMVGADCKLVHGDRWEQLDGSLMEITNVNVTTTAMGNEIREIMGNQTLTTNGNVTETIMGNMNHTVIGPELHTNVGTQNHTRLAPRIEAYAGDDNVEEPGVHCHQIETWLHNHNLAGEAVVMTVGMAINSVDAALNSVDVKGNDISVVSIMSIEPKVSEVNLKPLHTFLEGADAGAKAGAVTAGPGVGEPPNLPAQGSK
jgi:hypothetical protein